MLTLLVVVLGVAQVADGIFGGRIGRAQSIAVTGQLMCDGQPASGVKVKLYDDNTCE